MRHITVILILIFFCGCNSATKEYYPSGAIMREIKHVNDSTDFVISYFENGIVKSKGNLLNGVQEGNWTEYYQSNEIKWKGEYKNGVRKYVDENYNVEVLFDKEYINLSKGIDYNLKVRINNVHPEDIAIATTNGEIKLSSIETGTYTLTPENEGDLILIIYTTYSGKLKEIKRIKYHVS
jgi:antitoxin component YwqK of YwqJK toxin-antitoxin module